MLMQAAPVVVTEEQLDELEAQMDELRRDYVRMFRKLVNVILDDVRAPQRKYVWENDKDYILSAHGQFTDFELEEIERQYKRHFYPPENPIDYEPNEEL